eukprot:COSAG01_NODE_19958_length_979_cov_104.805682_2_plen_107_part_00
MPVGAALGALEWEELGSAVVVSAVDEATLAAGVPTRPAFEAAMIVAGGVRAHLEGQPERAAGFRFYDLTAIEGAFGRAAVMQESGGEAAHQAAERVRQPATAYSCS